MGNPMTGVQAHLPFPAEDAELLIKAANLLRDHEPEVDPRYEARLREAAAKLLEKKIAPLTATSPIEELLDHGIPKVVVTALKGEAILTVGALCEQTAEDLGFIHNIGRGTRRAQLCAVLAKFLMGLRPVPPK